MIEGGNDGMRERGRWGGGKEVGRERQSTLTRKQKQADTHSQYKEHRDNVSLPGKSSMYDGDTSRVIADDG